MLHIRDLKFSYPIGKSFSFPDLVINRSQHTLLLGDSGSGKTSLLHLAGGLLRSQSGEITVNDTNLSTLSAAALDHFRGKNISFVFQRNHLIDALTVRQNLWMAPYLAGESIDKSRAEAVLERLGLSERGHDHISRLSQGQVQRVAIARAIMNRPQIILADEPTSALDDTNCDTVVDLLLEAAAESGATLLIATHDHRLRNKISHQVKLSAN